MMWVFFILGLVCGVALIILGGMAIGAYLGIEINTTGVCAMLLGFVIIVASFWIAPFTIVLN